MLTFKNHIKNTILLAIPISIGQLGHVLMGVVDSIMVGQIGSTSLAAASLVNVIFFLVLVLGIGMSMAISSLIAIAKGAKRDHECGEILYQSMIVNIIFSIIIALILFIGSYFLSALGQTSEVTHESEKYLRILSYSVVPYMLFQTYRQFWEGLSLPRIPMFIAIAANIWNAFMNWVLIYGNLGFEPMGLSGAGWATLSTRILMGIALMIITIKSTYLKEYDTKFRIPKPDLKIISKVINIGLPSGIQYFFEVAAFAFAAIMIGWLGSVQLAAHQIGMSLATVSYMIILGIAAAGQIRVGNAVGEGSVSDIRKAGFSAITLSAGTMAGSGLIMILLRNFLPTIYISEPEVIELASKLLIIAAVFQIADGTQATGMGVLRGLTDVKMPMVIVLACYWGIAIPIGYYLAFILKLDTIGVWIGLLIGLFTVAGTLTIRFQLKSKQLPRL